MALIDIYYAQRTKVDDVEQNCFDLVTACYDNQGAAIASAMAKLTGDNSILLKPAAIDLTDRLCSDYIDSCNNMFGGDIVKDYIQNKKSTDSETACRTIAYQCFDKFGGGGYENFYSPQSGLFNVGEAIDWFSLYDTSGDIVSPCARELASLEGCSNNIEEVFGGFDKKALANGKIVYTIDDIVIDDEENEHFEDRKIRSHGVASEVYTKIVNNLSVQCDNINGYFVEPQRAGQYDYNLNNFCQLNTSDHTSIFYMSNAKKYLHYWYHFTENENVCPANYATKVDIQSWGACSCWENGGYRSANGTTEVCRPILPIANASTDNSSMPVCNANMLNEEFSSNPDESHWCQQPIMSKISQVCPRMELTRVTLLCAYQAEDGSIAPINTVLENVRQHKITETTASEVQVIGTAEISRE